MMNIVRPVSLLALAATTMTLVGCSTPVESVPPAEDAVAVSIRESIERSGRSPEFTQSSLAKPATPVLAGAQISLSYAGDAVTLLPKIAAANNLKFAVRGPQPYLPLFITVNAQGVTLTELLRDIALQFGQRAALALTDSMIEIRYNGVVQQALQPSQPSQPQAGMAPPPAAGLGSLFGPSITAPQQPPRQR